MPAKWIQQLANSNLAAWSCGAAVLAGAQWKDAKSRSKACGRLLALKGPRKTFVCNRELTLGRCAAPPQALEHPSLGGALLGVQQMKEGCQ